jgi:hypothetical protein
MEPVDGQASPTRSIDGQAGQPNRLMVNLGGRPIKRKKAATEEYAKDETRWRRVSQRLAAGQSRFLGEFDSCMSHFILDSVYFL